MSTLVQFLAAGVKGAENGTATFLLRGTASSAAAVLFNDFERTAQPGTNIITLDANGAAEVYCAAYVDVVLKTSAGVTLRTVTVGNGAANVEVRSDSFTGTDYDGSPANTVNQPITLAALLDKWNDSAGTTNWQVLISGVATNLSTAFASVSGLIVNVKDPAFGAVGDGVTDDTTAILAANTAAAGKPVYFPPGTYKITTLSLSDTNLNWFGAGPGASIISGTTQTNLIALTNNTNTGWKNFTNLSFASSGTYARLFNLEESQNVSFSRCTLDGSLCSADIVERGSASGLSKYLFSDCDFTLGASTPAAILTSAPTASSYISLKGCNFKVPSGFTGNILSGPGMVVEGCKFDASAVTSGVYHHIKPLDANVAGKYVGVFTGNAFLDGGSSGFVFSLTNVGANCDFSESGNTFAGFTLPTALTDPGHIYDYSNAVTYDMTSRIELGSRRGKQLNFTDQASVGDIVDPSVACFVMADTIVVNETVNIAGTYFMTTSGGAVSAPTGLRFTFVVLNNTGGTKNVNVGGSSAVVGQNTVVTGGRAMFDLFSYQETVGNTDIDVMSSAKASV